jgi:prevent-host-death family protein
MRTITVTKFKAHALGILRGIAETGESVVVTNRGKPLVEVSPCKSGRKKFKPGHLAGTITYKGDIVSPLGEEMWEACAKGPPK